MKKLVNAAISMALALTTVTCGSPEPTDTTASTPVEPIQTSLKVHATVNLGVEHLVKFVEYQPGIFGVIEVGRAILDTPVLTPEIKRLSWAEQYRHFAGASSRMPTAMVDAMARTPLVEEPMTSEPSQSIESTGEGPHFYTAGEQTWFNQNFCNGARICIQGFDFTNMQTPSKVGSATTVAMIGSEGTQNGTFQNFFWKCGGVWPFPTFCAWIENGTLVIVPGHFINSSVSGNGSWFFRWELRGGGANTTVSSAARF